MAVRIQKRIQSLKESACLADKLLLNVIFVRIVECLLWITPPDLARHFRLPLYAVQN